MNDDEFSHVKNVGGLSCTENKHTKFNSNDSESILMIWFCSIRFHGPLNELFPIHRHIAD